MAQLAVEPAASDFSWSGTSDERESHSEALLNKATTFKIDGVQEYREIQ